MAEVEIIFLGTGGGRYSMITQRRRTGGIRVLGPSNIQIDPGPGSIAYSNQLNLDPQKVECLLVSHCHPDHDNDAEVYIEAITQGGAKKRGVLIASKSVLNGNDACEPRISLYHKRMIGKVFGVSPGEMVSLGEVKVKAVRAKHEDPDTVGFRLTLPWGDIGYTSDTEYFDGLGEQFKSVRLLIMCVLRPKGAPIKGHLCTDDAVKILEVARPESSIITGFGMRMIYSNPDSEAKIIEAASNIRTIAAKDNMRLKLNMVKPEKWQRPLNMF
ncbi:MAG: MBL fold metallo-hydrolase [Candidatus Bathyarchaeia archaeon]